MNQQLEIIAEKIQANLKYIVSSEKLLKHEEALDAWKEFLSLHPADAAFVLDNVHEAGALKILSKLSKEKGIAIFDKMSEKSQVALLPHFETSHLEHIFKHIPSDRLTTIFEQIPDEELRKYLNLTHKKRRKKIISSLQHKDKTAGRMLNSDVMLLHKELTIHKVISMMQQLGPSYEILPRQYLVDADLKLEGYIEISDLLKNNSNIRLEQIYKKNEVVADVHDDQEEVAEVIKRYDLLSIPVTDCQGVFLGIISAHDVLDVIEEEMTEDSYKMSGLSPVEHGYVNANFWTVVFQRSKWLVPLLLFQSVSYFVINYFEGILTTFGLMGFITMLVGTGGNVGNQSATFVVRGLATGEINMKNKFYVFLREILISSMIGLVLVSVAIFRVWATNHYLPTVFATVVSLFLIVLTSVIMGTAIPMILDSWDIDPANSAAPFIATLMDIVGITIYCLIANFILN